MRQVYYNIRVIESTFRLQTVQSFSRATFRFCILIQPIVYTFVLYMMYRNSGISHYINYVILGSGLCSLWSSICFSSAGDIERERYMGTLENISCSPTAFPVIILGKIFSNTVMGLSGLLLSILFSALFFKETLEIQNKWAFFISFVFLLLAFIVVAVIIAPVFTLSRNARALMNCLEAPVFILCGFVTPVSILPVFIRPISYFLPPTLAIELLREGTQGIADLNWYAVRMSILTVLCLVYFSISKYLFKMIDYKTRISNTLGGA